MKFADCSRVKTMGNFILSAVILAGLAGSAPAKETDDGQIEIKPLEAAADDSPATQPATQPARPDKKWLDEIVVTATRGETTRFAAPYSIGTIKFNDFENNELYRTSTRAMEEEPSVMVQKTAHSQGSPYIRGFTSFRNIMMLDGVRLNNSIFRPGPNQYWNLVDPFTIDRLEITRGPGSVLYGSDGIGGVVNAILRKPTGYGEGFNWFRQVYYRFSTAERSNVMRGEINATYDDVLGVLAGGGMRLFGEVDGGGGVGPQDKTDYQEWTGDLKLQYMPNRDTQLTLAHYSFGQDDAWRTHKTIYGISWEGTTIGDELKRILDHRHSLTYLRYRQRNIAPWLYEAEATVSFQELIEKRWRVKSSGAADKQGVDVNTLGNALKFISPSPIGKLTYGVDWYHDDVDSFKDKYNADGTFDASEIQGPVGDDATYDLVGVYAQDQVPLGESFELLLGGRYTYARADAESVKDPDTGNEISVKEDWESLVGNARLSWFPIKDRVNVYAGLTQGFRAPNLSDLTRLDTARTNEIETPSPGLDPENYITYETGVKYREEDFLGEVSYYYTDISDMILRTPTGNVIGGDNEVTKNNTGQGYVHGVELAAKYRVHPQWQLFGNFSWMYGEVETFPTSAMDAEMEPLSRLMPPEGHFGVRWDSKNKKFWARLACTAAGKADELSTRDKADTQRIPPGGTPGYFTVDLNGGWRVNENVELWAGLENLTNEDYRIHGSGVNEPGINFKFGMKWRF